MTTTARNAISRVRRMIGDPEIGFHGVEDILSDLNQAAEDLSNRCECIRYGTYRGAVEGQPNYGMFNDYIGACFVGFRDNGSKQYRPLTRSRISTLTDINLNIETGSPVHYDFWGRSQEERVVTGAVDTASETATSVTINVDVDSISDVAVNLNDYAKPGDILRNVTDDNSEAVITVVDGNNAQITIANRPVGGVDNEYEEDDELRFINPAYSLKTLVISPAPDFTDSGGKESIFVYAYAQHRRVTQDHIDNENDDLEIDPQMNEAFLNHFAELASMAEDGVDSRRTETFASKYETKYLIALPKVRSDIKEFKSLWFDQALYSYPFLVANPEGRGYTGHILNNYKII